MPIQIDTREIAHLSPETIAGRYDRLDIMLAILKLGYDPLECVNKGRLAKQLLHIINNPPPKLLIEVGVEKIRELSAETIAARYRKEDIRTAVLELATDSFPDDWSELDLAKHLKFLAE